MAFANHAVAGAVLVALVGGCLSEPYDPYHGRGPVYVTVHTNEGVYYEGHSKITFELREERGYATIYYGAYGQGSYDGNVSIALDRVMDTDYEAELSRDEPAPGKAQLSRITDPAQQLGTVATAGHVRVHRDAGTHQMTITIESDDPVLAGTVQGEYGVMCLVPRPELGQPETGVPAIDARFETPFCRPFAGL